MEEGRESEEEGGEEAVSALLPYAAVLGTAAVWGVLPSVNLAPFEETVAEAVGVGGVGRVSVRYGHVNR